MMPPIPTPMPIAVIAFIRIHSGVVADAAVLGRASSLR